MATITDVAAHAGVGVSTVSRVLNDSPRVSASTRAKVLASIDELGYRPNPLARGLSRGRSHSLGVIVPFFTHASAVERLRGVVDALHGSPYDLVLFDVESPAQRDEQFAALTRRDRADGLLVLSLTPPRAEVARLAATGMPVVLVDMPCDENVPAVITDDVEGGRIATHHLVALGHERIAFIGEDPANEFGFESSTRRELGYAEVLRDAGIEPPANLVRYGPHDRTVAQRLTEQLLAQRSRPTAVFASSDVQATGVLAAARAAGLRVPDDLSVVGFDDIEISAYAGLTTVRQPLYESGRLGAAMLLDALEAATDVEPVVRTLPLELVERTTTGPPPGLRHQT
jgi:LacI family transcriptional regulator